MAVLGRLSALLASVNSIRVLFKDKVLLKRETQSRLVRVKEGEEVHTLIAGENDDHNQALHFKYARPEAVQKVRCTYCGSDVPSQNIVYNHEYAVCSSCNRPQATEHYPWVSVWQ